LKRGAFALVTAALACGGVPAREEMPAQAPSCADVARADARGIPMARTLVDLVGGARPRTAMRRVAGGEPRHWFNEELTFDLAEAGGEEAIAKRLARIGEVAHTMPYGANVYETSEGPRRWIVQIAPKPAVALSCYADPSGDLSAADVAPLAPAWAPRDLVSRLAGHAFVSAIVQSSADGDEWRVVLAHDDAGPIVDALAAKTWRDGPFTTTLSHPSVGEIVLRRQR
jgi:hypothetical protein